MHSTDPRSISAPELHRWLEAEGIPPRLIDVREDSELEVAPFPGDVLHLPLSRSSDWMDTVLGDLQTDRAVVVLCHAGIRSRHFGLWLLAQNGALEVWNLEGGIDAWSLQVDPAVPRY